MGRRKKLPLLENVEIEDFAAEGKSLARIDNVVLFVPGLIPGDVADIQVNRKKKNYMEGFVVKLRQPSPMRVDPKCSHFGVCGGCKWQHLPYEEQLRYKQKQVEDNLARIGKVELPAISTIRGAEPQYYYRNKLEYTFSDTRWLTEEEINAGEDITDRRALGFHIPGKFDRILDVHTCYLQDDLSNQIRNAVKDFTLKNNYSYYHQRKNEGMMRNLIVRNTRIGEWMVIVVFHDEHEELIRPLLLHLEENFPEITSLQYVINPKVNDTIHDLAVHEFKGRDHIFEKLDDLTFKIGPKSFFQTNSAQAEILYGIAADFADLKGDEVVYDLYTGAGTIACYVAGKCKKVVGVEYVKEAIEDAHVNAEINEISNASFYAGDMKDVLTDEFIAQHGNPDVIITDPPRAGMHGDVVKMLLRIAAQRIVYVSCNPATQARDIELLSEVYKVTAVQPVDMFPHTHHVENVVCLDKKNAV